MAELSFAWKYEGTTLGFSESEVDVARQLIKLCSDNDNVDHSIGLTGKRRRVEDDELGAASAIVNVEDEQLKLRKRKSRSIHYIYKSTKPLVVFSAKKICST
ncbi:hypothetical protein DITRI_Ditri17bG0029600 [Diplodiscus trichospermus]